jgi:hypothetical protein
MPPAGTVVEVVDDATDVVALVVEVFVVEVVDVNSVVVVSSLGLCRQPTNRRMINIPNTGSIFLFFIVP